MELIKKLFSCLAILSICLRVKSRGVNVNEIKNKGSSHKEIDCFCIPRNPQSVKVIKYIAPNNEPQDRLIIYLYKNSNNNSITIYVPGKEKQRELPELTLDEGDRLNQLNTEYVNQLFDIYPEDVIHIEEATIPVKRPDNRPYNILDMDYIQDFSNIIQVKPSFNVNKDEIRNIRPNKENVPLKEQSPTSNNDYFIYPEDTNEFPEIQIPIIPDTKKKQIKNTPHIIQITPPRSDIPENIKKSQVSPIDIDAEIASLPVDFIPNHYTIFKEKDLLTDDKIPSKDMNIVQSFYVPNVKIEKQNQPPGSESSLEIGTERDIDVLRPLTEKRYEKIIPQGTYDSGDLFILNSKPYADSIPLIQQHQQQASNSPIITTNDIHPKFRKWFWDQIRVLEIKRPLIKRVINLRKLLILIIKTLHRNGIQISSSGDLQDSNGNIVQMTDLKLRPILLGDPVQNDKFIDANKCYLPYHVQYLEAVLVTLANPPKILGIIPLGKINLSQDLYDGNPRCKSGLCLNRPCCKKWPCHYTKPHINRINKNVEKPQNNINIEKKPLMNNRLKTNSLLRSFIKSRRMSDDINIEVPVNDSLGKSETVEVPMDEELKETEQVEDIQEVEDDDDSLGVRIIGGTPATSSGTPVNIKGRTGIILD